MKRSARRTATATAAAALALALGACGAPAPPTTTELPQPSEYAQQLFDGVNQERAKAGLSKLEWSACLEQEAIPRAQKTTTEEALEHEPLGSDCLDNEAAGENLSRGPYAAQTIVEMWMASPGHEANIVRPGFSIAGVGCVEMPDAAAGIACSFLFAGGE